MSFGKKWEKRNKNEKYKDNTKLMCDEHEEIEYTNDEFS